MPDPGRMLEVSADHAEWSFRLPRFTRWNELAGLMAMARQPLSDLTVRATYYRLNQEAETRQESITLDDPMRGAILRHLDQQNKEGGIVWSLQSQGEIPDIDIDRIEGLLFPNAKMAGQFHVRSEQRSAIWPGDISNP